MSAATHVREGRPRPVEVGRGAAWTVVGVLAAVVGGGFAINAALDGGGGAPIQVRGVVSVASLSGWRSSGPVESGGWTFGRLTRGSGTLDVAVGPAAEPSPTDVAAAYVEGILRPQLTRLTVDDRLQPVTLASGVVGVRFRYAGFVRASSSSIEGEVTAVLSGAGAPVVFDAWSGEGLLPFMVGDVHRMIDGAVIA